MADGQTEILVEAPDLIVVRSTGALKLSDAETLGDALRRTQRAGVAHIMSVVEGSSFEISGPVRRAFIEATRDLKTIHDAVVGASFHIRIIGKLVASGARVLTGNDLRLHFVDNEVQAREWLRQQGCLACGSTRGSKPG